MKKNIIFVSLFGDINFNSNSRLTNIYNSFYDFNRTVITSDFDHSTKEYKKGCMDNVKFIHVPSYKKNISIKRLYSHIVFAIKLRYNLNKLKAQPDMMISLMPSSLSTYFCGKFCKKNNIKFVIDVVDLWPESLYPINPLVKLIKPIFYPWTWVTYKAYKMTDYISAESKEYAIKAVSKSKTEFWSYTYLGVDIEKTKKLIQLSNLKKHFNSDEILICYGGSLGNSYDFDSLLEAIKYIDSKKIKYKFLFVGDGEYKDYISSYTSKYKLNIEITGYVSYPDFLKYLSLCDIGINTFKKSTKVVYSYKFSDYVSSSLFILNNLKGETAEMVTKYSVGVNFNHYNLSETLFDVCDNWEKYRYWRNNNLTLINKELNSNIIYETLKNDIINKLELF